MCNSSKWRSKVLKVAFAKTVYAIWRMRNAVVYSTKITRKVETIIETIVNTTSVQPKLREKIAQLMLG